eukprot:3176350-Amphidinium_carterae.1
MALKCQQARSAQRSTRLRGPGPATGLTTLYLGDWLHNSKAKAYNHGIGGSIESFRFMKWLLY